MDTRKPDKAAPAAEDGRATPAPLVSVIVGVYNKERFVGECLRSVLAQTYKNWELIVVDDASTDNSLAEVERAVGSDPRVRIIRRATNSGLPAVARNEGIRVAHGKYVAFLDADDLWNPEKLAVQTAFMEMHPEFPFTHTKCEEIDENGVSFGLRHGGVYPPDGDCLESLLKHCFICTSTVMVCATLVERIGLFPEERSFTTGEDYDFFVRCSGNVGIGMPEGVWAAYRRFKGSISRDTKYWKASPTDYLRHKNFLSRPELWKNRVSRAWVLQCVFESADENAYAARLRGQWGHAAWFAWQLIYLFPMKAEGWKHLAASIVRRK